MKHHLEHDTSKPVLELKDVTVKFGAETILDNISFSVKKGERIAVVGPNGAGKSTLFKTITGTIRPGSGNIFVYGDKPLAHICIGYVPQSSMIDWNFPVTVYDVVMMGRTGRIGLFKRPSGQDKGVVFYALGIVKMAEFADRQIGMLSGGQRQRVFLARAIAQDAGLLLMDEPLAGLDAASQQDIYRIIEYLSEEKGVTILVSTHNLNAAGKNFPKIILLNKKVIVIGSGKEVMNKKYLLSTFGGHLAVIGSDNGIVAVNDTCCSHGEER